jgi:hypothetical protein
MKYALSTSVRGKEHTMLYLLYINLAFLGLPIVLALI